MAKKAAKKASPKKAYVALHNVRHDGKLYGAGKGVKLTEEQAEKLLKAKAVRLADSSADLDIEDVDEEEEADAASASATE